MRNPADRIGLSDTAAAQNRFAPRRNLHNEGPWSVDIPLSVLAANIALTTISLDAFIFNNAGTLDIVVTVAGTACTHEQAPAKSRPISQPAILAFI